MSGVGQLRALLVHPSRTAVEEMREVLRPYVTCDAAHGAAEMRRLLGSHLYAAVILDDRPPLDGSALIAEVALAQPEAFIVVLTPESERGRTLDAALPGRVFRFLAGPEQRWQLTGIVSEGLKLQRLEREQRELVKQLRLERNDLQQREQQLDALVRERTRELEDAYERLKAASRQALLGLAEAIEAKDPYTKGHCGRTAVYALTLGREARLDASDLELLEFGSFLHDIGKIGVRDAVLLKPGALSDDEWVHMRGHPLVGSQIASQLDMLRPRAILSCIRNHHERWDGMGYPDRLAGESIPLLARIVTLADAYDAMATDRPYKRAIPPEQCREIMRRQAGPQFDPELVELFTRKDLFEDLASMTG